MCARVMKISLFQNQVYLRGIVTPCHWSSETKLKNPKVLKIFSFKKNYMHHSNHFTFLFAVHCLSVSVLEFSTHLFAISNKNCDTFFKSVRSVSNGIVYALIKSDSSSGLLNGCHFGNIMSTTCWKPCLTLSCMIFCQWI